MLAASMASIGLQSPITVWVPDESKIVLVAGAHRLAAAKSLGWEYIDALEISLDGDERELWEIDENLCRSELTDAEKREHLRRRKALWEQRQPKIEVAHHAPPQTAHPKARPQVKGFAAETAAATGMSKRRINQLLADPPSQR